MVCYASMDTEIHSDSAIRFGAPCVAGTRISVSDVLGYISAGDSIDMIVRNFPELTEEKIRAALKYASDVLNTTSAHPMHETPAR